MTKREDQQAVGPKKMVIYDIVKDHPIPSRRVLAPLRSVTVHPTFHGIRDNGYIDFIAFKELAQILEPTAKVFVHILNL